MKFNYFKKQSPFSDYKISGYLLQGTMINLEMVD